MKFSSWVAMMVLFLFIVTPVTASQFFIAKGDSAYVKVQNPYGTCWFFAKSDAPDFDKFYDMPSSEDGGGLTYCAITKDMSNAMDGEYTLVYTHPIVKDNKTVLKDVSWTDGKFVSVFADNPSIKPTGSSRSAKDDLIAMISKHQIDGMMTYDLSVEDPYLHVNTIYGINSQSVKIKGTSNFQDGTKIKIIIDEQDHIAEKNLYDFTFYATVARPYSEIEGTFEDTMIIPMQEMHPGWHEVTVYSGDLVTTARFPLYETSWTPFPTPTQYINYFGNGSIKPDVVTVEKTVIVTKEIDRWHTATPTPPVTDALGNVINYPYKPEENTTIPVEWPVAAMVALAVIVLWRDYKWKG